MIDAAEIKRRFLDLRKRLYEHHDLTAVDDYVHPEFRSHNSRTVHGIPGYKAFVRGFHQGLPDLRPITQQILVEGDRLMAMTRWEGTHTGTFFGTPATCKALHFETADLYQLRDGLLFEHWDVVDRLDAAITLGQIRPTG